MNFQEILIKCFSKILNINGLHLPIMVKQSEPITSKFDTDILKEVWIKPTDGSYFFKKSHAVAYAQAIVVQMNLMNRAKYSFDAPSKN